jgi:hypothetical protein
MLWKCQGWEKAGFKAQKTTLPRFFYRCNECGLIEVLLIVGRFLVDDLSLFPTAILCEFSLTSQSFYIYLYSHPKPLNDAKTSGAVVTPDVELCMLPVTVHHALLHGEAKPSVNY